MADPAEEPPKAVNPYKALGLSKTSTAAEVKTAYKKLALKHHPGTNRFPDPLEVITSPLTLSFCPQRQSRRLSPLLRSYQISRDSFCLRDSLR